MIKKSLYLLFLLFSTYCLSGTIDPGTSDSKYLEYGAKHTSVVKIYGKYPKEKNFIASAVVIDSHNILTAAHIVKNAVECMIEVDNKIYNICVPVCYHEEYNDNEFGNYDIALGYSDKEIIMDFYPKLYEEQNEVGKVCSISGFGLTGNFNTGVKFSDSKRRAGSNIVDKIEKQLLICSPSRNGNRKTELEFIIASGDSGGGLFIDGKLAGINSCIMADKTPTSNYLTESGHTRISVMSEWIKKNRR